MDEGDDLSTNDVTVQGEFAKCLGLPVLSTLCMPSKIAFQ